MSEQRKGFASLKDSFIFRLGGALSLFSLAVMISLILVSSIPILFIAAVWLMPIFAFLFLTGLLLMFIGMLIHVYQRFSGTDGLWALKTGPLR